MTHLAGPALFDRDRFLLIQIFRTGLWLPVVQTILWLVHGVRDGRFVEWSVAEIGPVGDLTGLYGLTILFTVLAVLPLIIAVSDHKAIRALVFALSLLMFAASLGDWIGYQSPLPYQIILKAVHMPLAGFGVFVAWRWLRGTPWQSPFDGPTF